MSLQKKSVTGEELRQFGCIMAIGIILVFGIVFPWFGDRPSPLRSLQCPLEWPRDWLLFVSAGFFIVAVILPILLKPVYWMWMKIGAVLGWINTRIILSIIYYILIFPAGTIMRLFNDPMMRRFDAKAETYRVPSNKININQLEKPF